MTKHMVVVLSNCVEGRDDEFNDWYTNQHLTDVLKVEGFVAAQRFRLSDTQLEDEAAKQLKGTKPAYRYCAIYEVESDDLERVTKALLAVAYTGAMPISETLDLEGTDTWFFTPIGERVTPGG